MASSWSRRAGCNRAAAAVPVRVAPLHDPVFRLPEREAVVVAVNGEHDEVVDCDRRHLRVELNDDVPLRRGDRGLEVLLRGDAHRLGADELMWGDLGRGDAAGESRRDDRLDRVLDQKSGADDGGDQDSHHEQSQPSLASPWCRRLELIGFDRRGAPRGPRLAHFRAVASAIACTRPCVVYSRATIATSRPSLRALSAVTGPMHAISASPRIAGSRSSGNARTKL